MKVFILSLVILAASCEDHGTETNLPSASSKSRQGTAEQRQKLYDALMLNYRKNVNPDDPNVHLGVSLVDVDINEERSTLETNLWLKMSWEDSRLKWDPAEYSGVAILRMEYDTIWSPDITLYNNADLSKTSTACWHSNVLVTPDGKVLWVPPCHYSSFCKTTLKTHPYEPQHCFLKFGSWTFDSQLLDVNFYHNVSQIDVSDFWAVSEWDIISNNAVKHIKTYECCPEPYADLTFNMTLMRKPSPCVA